MSRSICINTLWNFDCTGKELKPSQVSIDLGLEPSLVRNTGETRSRNLRAQQAMWAFDGYSAEHDCEMWDSLEEGLVFVLSKLWPARDKIKKYISTYDAVWWCGHYQSSFDGGPILSPSILKAVGEFGVELFIDNYFNSEDERNPRKNKDTQMMLSWGATYGLWLFSRCDILESVTAAPHRLALRPSMKNA